MSVSPLIPTVCLPLFDSFYVQIVFPFAQKSRKYYDEWLQRLFPPGTIGGRELKLYHIREMHAKFFSATELFSGIEYPQLIRMRWETMAQLMNASLTMNIVQANLALGASKAAGHSQVTLLFIFSVNLFTLQRILIAILRLCCSVKISSKFPLLEVPPNFI